MKEFKVFISHASDTENECNMLKKIIDQENANHFKSRDYVFIPFCFEDIIPGSGFPQKEKIDPEIIDKSCILMIFILKSRLGTIRNDETGVEHEYELGKEFKKEIMIYRCDFLMHLSEIDPGQLQMVNDFFERIRNENLYVPLREIGEFETRLRSDFSKWIEGFINDNETNFAKDMDDFNKLNRGF